MYTPPAHCSLTCLNRDPGLRCESLVRLLCGSNVVSKYISILCRGPTGCRHCWDSALSFVTVLLCCHLHVPHRHSNRVLPLPYTHRHTPTSCLSESRGPEAVECLLRGAVKRRSTNDVGHDTSANITRRQNAAGKNAGDKSFIYFP